MRYGGRLERRCSEASFRPAVCRRPGPGPLMRHGACTILIRAGRVLAITKNRDLSDLNLPGGGVELRESFMHAAIRELFEETQVDASRATLVPVNHRRGPRGESVAFLVLGDVRFPAVMESRPFEGFVRWAAPMELLQPTCTHARVNRTNFARVGLV